MQIPCGTPPNIKPYTNPKMTKVFLSLFCLICFSCTHQEPKNSIIKYSVIKFDTLIYDFGKIKDGDTVRHTFNFSNIGSSPAVIYDISTSCGCTAAAWTKTPVLPGKKGSIEVQFTKKHDPGIHHKVIVIKANTKDPYIVINILATVHN